MGSATNRSDCGRCGPEAGCPVRADDHLLLITEGLRRLSLDERFVALVEDEDLATLPAVLSDRIDDYQNH
jgi:hypothetical protein